MVHQRTISVSDASHILSVSERQVQRYCRTGRLLCEKEGKAFLVDLGSVMALLKRKLPPTSDADRTTDVQNDSDIPSTDARSTQADVGNDNDILSSDVRNDNDIPSTDIRSTQADVGNDNDILSTDIRNDNDIAPTDGRNVPDQHAIDPDIDRMRTSEPEGDRDRSAPDMTEDLDIIALFHKTHAAKMAVQTLHEELPDIIDLICGQVHRNQALENTVLRLLKDVEGPEDQRKNRRRWFYMMALGAILILAGGLFVAGFRLGQGA